MEGRREIVTVGLAGCLDEDLVGAVVAELVAVGRPQREAYTLESWRWVPGPGT